MEIDKQMKRETGGALFGLSLGERKYEDFRGLEERDLGPKTKETELRLGLPGDWVEGEYLLFEPLPSDEIFMLPKSINLVGAKRAFWDTVDALGSTYNKSGCLPSWSSNARLPSSSCELPHNNNVFSLKPNPVVSSTVKDPSSVVTEPEVKVVVGWPPLRSFRKNFAASSSKPPADKEKQCLGESINGNHKIESVKKGLFVKINMDGVPIGRKIDLHAYESYQELSVAVDLLFRGLLAAQNALHGDQADREEEKPITGLLDGSGEYTLVYEDDEGDRMLVGDVPWGMFVNSVKRLRVSKSSDLSVLLVRPNVRRQANVKGVVDDSRVN